MTRLELQHFLHAQIPLSAAMQVSVLEASPKRIELGAPLAPNINHLATVFGGSASALAILAAWSLAHTRLAAQPMRTRLLIQRNTMHYAREIAGDFTAVALAPAAGDWQRFLRTLARHGRARIALAATLWYAGGEAGHLEGDFVALARAPGQAASSGPWLAQSARPDAVG